MHGRNVGAECFQDCSPLAGLGRDHGKDMDHVSAPFVVALARDGEGRAAEALPQGAPVPMMGQIPEETKP
jgi:hypothetical protein